MLLPAKYFSFNDTEGLKTGFSIQQATIISFQFLWFNTLNHGAMIHLFGSVGNPWNFRGSCYPGTRPLSNIQPFPI